MLNSSSFIFINVLRHKNAIRKEPHLLFRTEAELNGFQLSNDIWLYGSWFIFIDRMHFMAPTLNAANPLFALVIRPGGVFH